MTAARTVLAMAASAAFVAVAITYVHVLALARGIPNAQFMMAGIGTHERPVYYGVAIALALVAVVLSPNWLARLYSPEVSPLSKAVVCVVAVPAAVILWSLVLAGSVILVETAVNDPFDDKPKIELSRSASPRP